MRKSINAQAPALYKFEHSPNLESGQIEVKDRFFLQALRSVGYDAYTAIAELIDNSIDAGASLITVDYESKSAVLVIQDNGRGMSAEQLDIAMDLGSDQEYSEDQISYFGSGMKTAIMNLVSRKDSEVAIETNDGTEKSMIVWHPLKSFRNFNGPIALEKSSLPKGTKISINGVEKFQIATLKRLLGMMLFPTLKTETLVVKVNEVDIIGTDPLYRYSDKTLTNYVTAKVKGHEIRIDAVMLNPEQEKNNWDAADGSEKKFSYHKGGAYVNYGGRYIEYGGFLGIRTTHPTLNMVRFEFTVPKELTEVFGVKFNKTKGLDLDIKKDRNEPLNDIIQKIKDMVNWSAAQREKMKVDNATAEDKSELEGLEKKLNEAARKARFKKPTFKKPKDSTKSEEEEIEVVEPIIPVDGEKPTTKTRIHRYELYELHFENLGNTAVFWHLGYERDKFIITINDNHVFYTEYWINMNETAKTAVSFLLGAIAHAEYDSIKNNPSISEVRPELFWEEFWSQVSLKLRHLTIS